MILTKELLKNSYYSVFITLQKGKKENIENFSKNL